MLHVVIALEATMAMALLLSLIRPHTILPRKRTPDRARAGAICMALLAVLVAAHISLLGERGNPLFGAGAFVLTAPTFIWRFINAHG